MKKEIKPAQAIAAVVVVLIIGGAVAWKALAPPPELPRAPITVGEEAVPAYMKENLSPEMKRMIEEQSKEYGSKPGAATPAPESGQQVPGR